MEEYFANGILVHNCRYLVMSIGGGPDWLIHETPAESLPIEILKPLGTTMAVRPQDDPKQRNWWDEDESPSAGRTAVSPFV